MSNNDRMLMLKEALTAVHDMIDYCAGLSEATYAELKTLPREEAITLIAIEILENALEECHERE